MNVNRNVQKPFMTIDTDVGPADVTWQGPRFKSYVCPLCTESLDQEWHVVIKPKQSADLRRHAHKECLDEFMKQKLEINLLPRGRYAL